MLQNTNQEEVEQSYKSTLPPAEPTRQDSTTALGDIIIQELKNPNSHLTFQQLTELQAVETARIDADREYKLKQQEIENARTVAAGEQRLAEMKELGKQEIELNTVKTAQQKARSAFTLEMSGLAFGILLSAGILIYAMIAGLWSFALLGLFIFAFSIAIASERSLQAVMAYFKSRSKQNDDSSK